MKLCSNCNTAYSDKLPKCPKCGSTQTFIQEEAQIACPNCGENNFRGRSNCFDCGTPL